MYTFLVYDMTDEQIKALQMIRGAPDSQTFIDGNSQCRKAQSSKDW